MLNGQSPLHQGQAQLLPLSAERPVMFLQLFTTRRPKNHGRRSDQSRPKTSLTILKVNLPKPILRQPFSLIVIRGAIASIRPRPTAPQPHTNNLRLRL